jgi:hypothetical protein
MMKKILMILCGVVGVAIIYSQVRKLGQNDRSQAVQATLSSHSLVAAERANSATFKVCKRMQDAGIAKGCYPSNESESQIGNVVMYHDDTRFFVSTPSNTIPGDEWRRKSVGEIVELTDQLPYEEVAAKLQSKVAEVGLCKAAIAKSTGIAVILPPDASCDLVPRVQEVLDRG